MRRGEQSPKKNAQSTDDDVGNAQERVLAAHDCACRDQHFLGSAVSKDVKF